MATQGRCKFCNKDSLLVDAHIIPKGFYRNDGDFHFAVVNMTKAERSRRSHKGVWDDTILCEVCEARFAPIDDYAVKNLYRRRTEASPYGQNGSVYLDRNGGPLALSLPWIDGEKIALFALFVLWRAGVSSRQECWGVRLGPFEERIRAVLNSNTLDNTSGMHVTLWWERNPNVVGVIILPYRSKIYGVRFWNFWCGGYYFVVQTDNRPNVFQGTPNLLGSGAAFAISTSVLDRKEGIQMARTMKDSHQIYGDPWKGRWSPPTW
jgi:hypothetical protein